MKKIPVILALFLIVAASCSSLIILNANDDIPLAQGRNYLQFNFSSSLSAKDLVSKNPDIEAISFTENNQTVGYVNVLGGIGKNFLLQPNSVYEIISKKQTKLKIT
jgi:hypothetical protein